MSEIRLFITTTEKNAEAILALMSDAFEDEGYAIATMEIDEKADIWEASLYLMADEEEEMHERFAALVKDAFPDAV
ncbi:MAG TPA: 50S ribosomal protein L11 methyltransferase, partial [Mycoplana sp.]|nr:50S ribosomal protein L11 methyltransferase [Mycoplana sp.]